MIGLVRFIKNIHFPTIALGVVILLAILLNHQGILPDYGIFDVLRRAIIPSFKKNINEVCFKYVKRKVL